MIPARPVHTPRSGRATRSGPRPAGQLRSSGELFEEAHVAGVEVAYVGDAVLDHGDALYSHAEGEAGDFFRVVEVVGGV